MKQSLYNYCFKNGDNIIIFNARINALAKLSLDEYEQLKNVIQIQKTQLLKFYNKKEGVLNEEICGCIPCDYGIINYCWYSNLLFIL